MTKTVISVPTNKLDQLVSDIIFAGGKFEDIKITVPAYGKYTIVYSIP